MKKALILLLISCLITLIIVSCSQSKASYAKLSKYNIFSELEDEYKISGYFMNSREKAIYQKLDYEQKVNFLFAFWLDKDPNPVTKENEFVQDVKNRIKYCNLHFSHFEKGWKSDRGRIYIKYGEPFEMSSENTGQGNAADKHHHKDYQIWKYRLNDELTYIFFDIQSFGDYRLIFSSGDAEEQTVPNWLEYLGSEFSTDVLY